ncbi:N-acetylmuramoyl-L-alanine amidase [Gloeobacter morelensis]|uniref:N-acetylmuramoyl-L-alanine amidase n=1 Tax=Gloeobacter morelensis MG652769 TaxID=2781736 RepID=A0ABY3PJD8_9CYAN|nr:N-acetylmuramoyl-L-alanine amidase [Gloeobacter morelensis]UFP93672.1 N-acetylmuramoyl-L-alanine amidase [Gloeobacter morelensis MG652769]
MRNKRVVLWSASSVLAWASCLACCSTALAMPQLTGWQFDSQAQQLSFFTRGSVQPRIQIVEKPRRVVVDLPGADVFAPSDAPVRSGPVRFVRAGQFDPQTARMVMELAEDAPQLQPEQVRVRQVAPDQWLVQLLPNVPPPPGAPSAPPVVAPPLTMPPAVGRRVLVGGIEVRPEGFLVKTGGYVRSDARLLEEQPPRVVVDIEEAELAKNFAERNLAVNQQGVTRLRTGQFQDDPPLVRVVLDLGAGAANAWEARYSVDLGGVLIRPAGSAPAATAPTGEKVSLQSAQLTPEGLVFHSDLPPRLETNWENPNEFRIVFSPAQLPANFSGPLIDAASPIDNLNIRQVDDRTVVALVRVSPGTRVGDPRPLDGERRRVLVPLYRRSATPTSPVVPDTYDPLPNGSGRRIVLDAGHGGKDPGAMREGVREKDLNLAIVRRLNNKLRAAGYYTILARSDDTFISLGERVDITKATQGDIFVSVHVNTMPSRSDIQGIETYYTHSRSARLAYVLHRRLVERTGKPDRGVRVRGLYVTRHNAVPAVLLEVGFLTNPEERAQLQQPEYQELIADAIAQGLQDYAR